MNRFRSLPVLALVGIGFVACVGLDKPKNVEACVAENTCMDNVATGGATVVETGGAALETGGVTATGGVPATGGAEVSTGGAGPDTGVASGGTTADASIDVEMGSGGATKTGGDAGSGGVIGTGGVSVDASPDTPKPDTAIIPDTPAATGGITATGGIVSTGGTVDAAVVKTGGVTATGGAKVYDCANAMVPTDGLINDFTNYTAATKTWTTGALSGDIYAYRGTNATTAVAVQGTPAGLHITGTISSGSYGGGGMTFFTCLTVASFTRVSFDVYGSANGCNIELQLQNYDQRTADVVPPGACKADGGTSCYQFPVKSQVVSLNTTVNPPGNTVTTPLSGLTNWSAAIAGQIVGIQWQFTGACTINATFTNIKFLP